MRDTFFKHSSDRFYFIDGNTSDIFCQRDLKVVNLRKSLHKHLKNLGYESILFYEGTRGVVALDEKSFSLAFDKKSSADEVNFTKKIKINPFQGPLGGKLKKEKEVTQEKEEQIKESFGEYSKKMNDIDIVKAFDTILKNKSIKTAIIFSNYDDFRKHTKQEVLREFSSTINSWNELKFDNENIVIFILPKRMELIKENDRYDTWELLNNRQKTGTFNISLPNKDEIVNIINHYRILKELEVDFLNFDEICDTLVRVSREKNLDLNFIAGKIKRISDRKVSINKTEIEKEFEITMDKQGIEKLSSMQGVEDVKEEIERLVFFANKKQEEFKQKTSPLAQDEVSRIIPKRVYNALKDVNLNIALVGNPGTGKTTIAKIVSEIYKENNILEVGHLIEAKASDLIAGYVGQTAINTQNVINSAIGGVLFIDEAYKLNSNDFGKEAIDTLVEAITQRAGEFAVIIAGYPKEISEFMEKNPGLQRRFANNIKLKDYKPEILEKIFKDKMKKESYSFDSELEELFPHFLRNWYDARDEKNFGNAGAVLNLFQDMAKNAIFKNSKELKKEDIKDEKLKQYLKMQTDDTMDSAMQKLDGIVGLNSVKEQVRTIINSIKMEKLRNKDSKVLAGHYIFKGNPGTGKTTVARIFASVLKNLKVLPKGHLIEVTREDLVAGYVGQTAEKTKKILEESLGGILFIDEAYSLSKGGENDFGKEAIDTIVPFMENNLDKFTLIVAGYSDDMDKFLNANTGLKSRFNNNIVFEDYTEDELLEIYKGFAKNENFILDVGVEEKIKDIFKELKNDKHFGNGRVARQLFASHLSKLNNRISRLDLVEGDERLFLITVEDL